MLQAYFTKVTKLTYIRRTICFFYRNCTSYINVEYPLVWHNLW